MSLDMIRIIPTDPNFIPRKGLEDKLHEVCEQLFPEAGEVEVDYYDKIRFIDQGENFETLACPECQAVHNFSNEETSEWWYANVDDIDEEELYKHNLVMPCCKRRVAFSGLKFNWPAGFASFEIAIHDPGIDRPASEKELETLATIVGTPLTQIRAHY